MSATAYSTTSQDLREQLLELRTLSLRAGPAKSDLHRWVFSTTGIWIPKYRVCEGHNAPYEFLWDILYGEVNKALLWACRMGGKSFIDGLICWLKGREGTLWDATIMGGSKFQSQRAYEATDIFWSLTTELGSRDVLLKEPLQSVTKFKDGSQYQILAASMTSALGPHPNTLILDEVDEIKPEVLNAAMQQPVTKHGHRATWIMTSTMHHVGGVMDDWTKNYAKRGYSLYKWCILEVMMGCWDYHCSTCPLTEWCQGRMLPVMDLAEHEQIAAGDIKKGERPHLGFNTVEDVIDKVLNAEMEEETETGFHKVTIDIGAALFIQRPSRTGLVFKVWDEAVHIVKADMLEIATEWPKYRTIDFGYTNPYICLYFAITPADVIIFFDEYVITEVEHPELVERLKGDWGTRYITNVVDPSGADESKQMRTAGFPTIFPKNNSVADGLNAVRHLLTRRPKRFIVSDKCRYTITTALSYRYPKSGLSENPEKKDDHAWEAIRRAVVCWQEERLPTQAGLKDSIKLSGRERSNARGTETELAYAANKAEVKAFKSSSRRATSQLPDNL